MLKNRFRYRENSPTKLAERGGAESIRKMKATVFACVLLTVAVFAGVNGVPKGHSHSHSHSHKADEENEKPIPSDDQEFPDFTNGLLRKLLIEGIMKNMTNIDFLKAPNFQFFNRSGIVGPGGLTLSSIYNTLLSGVHSLYQDLLNRQQAFINLLTCGNCVNEGWDAIMEVVQTVPELDWVYTPNSGSPATFFTAVHHNGTVTGIGGSIVNDRPVAEYAFGNDGIVQHLPSKHKKN